MKTAVYTPRAPKPAGPYSQACIAGGFVFVSGQGPVDPASGQTQQAGIRADTQLICENIKTILESAGSSLRQVVKVTVYLSDINEWAAMNEVYATYFGGDQSPARTTIQSAALPRGFRVEMDCIAYR